MNNPYAQALEFLSDAGVTIATMDTPNNRFDIPDIIVKEPTQTPIQEKTAQQPIAEVKAHKDIISQAQDVANKASTLDELKQAIADFDGLSLKKNATNLVFADGNPQAKIMVIGDAPAADEDRQGTPFVGNHGQLLDKIFDCIGLSRTVDDAQKSIYLSNILNWRPPGNRTPTDAEIDIARPFIKRHIELINPDIIVFCGGMPAQTLLYSKESVSRLRGRVHDYNDTTKAIVTYHPSSLLNTPLQKKKVWDDMITLKGLIDG
jgi:uracil-DNA glycosylase family 4